MARDPANLQKIGVKKFDGTLKLLDLEENLEVVEPNLGIIDFLRQGLLVDKSNQQLVDLVWIEVSQSSKGFAILY